jgi:hypothetical protein
MQDIESLERIKKKDDRKQNSARKLVEKSDSNPVKKVRSDEGLREQTTKAKFCQERPRQVSRPRRGHQNDERARSYANGDAGNGIDKKATEHLGYTEGGLR